MLNFLRKLFCIHSWEWEEDINEEDVKICRKCNKECGCEIK